MDITLDQARAFCAVVEHRSYVAAARSLHKSHSSLVYAIQCLEEQCGFQVLDRRQYRSTLTPKGKRAYEKCRALLGAEADLKNLCRDLEAGWEPSVRIVYDGVLPTEPFVHILKTLRDQNIPTRVQIYSDYLHGVEKSFEELNAQFMVAVVPPQDPANTYISRALKPMKSLLVAHKDHPLHARAEPWSIEELKTFTFLTVRGADQSLRLGTKELEDSSAFHLSDFSFKKDAILKRTGFGWLPEYMIRSELKAKTLRKIRWERSSEQNLHPQILYKKESVRGRASQMILENLLRS
jgi:DNA-binding transcriptional LysR family regulator